MKGLELSRKYFEKFGIEMLENEFQDILQYLAVGFVGSGSEKFGFDDEISMDHDFEPGFCIFLPGEDVVDRRTEFLLERAYSRLPREFAGIRRQLLSPVGGNRNGVFRTSEFYRRMSGTADGRLSIEEWLMIPEYALAEAVNGEIFFDNYGEFTDIRQRLKDMPEDIRLKKLAGNLLIMAQSGQYNFSRCLRHGEPEASQLACQEFVDSSMKVFFLLNNQYMPYYKWSFRALRMLDGGKALADKLSFLLLGKQVRSVELKHESDSDENLFTHKQSLIEEVSGDIISLLQKQNLTKAVCNDLEKHAYSVNDHIHDSELRNMNILAAIN